jgi:hypothetical protein
MYRTSREPEYQRYTAEIGGEIVCNECGCFILGKVYKNKNAEAPNYFFDNNPLKCGRCYAGWLEDQEEEEE